MSCNLNHNGWDLFYLQVYLVLSLTQKEPFESGDCFTLIVYYIIYPHLQIVNYKYIQENTFQPWNIIETGFTCQHKSSLLFRF